MSTGIYKRVSTGKQELHGVSLDTQQERLIAYCSFKGLDNIKEYMDVGTGTNAERSDYQRMLSDVKSGKIKNIVVLKLDRLTRSINDLDGLVKLLAEHDCELHSATENIDTASASGRMMVNIIGIFAQWESESISERVSINMDSLSEKGVWMSSVPFGFYHGDDKRLKIKDDEANILREAFDMILSGHSCTSAERTIRSKYNLDWAHNYLRRKVRVASTIGNVERNDVITYGTHEGIITKEEQAKLVQIIEGNRASRRFVEHDDVFRRRIVCFQCGSIMSANARSSNDYKTVNYSYTCSVCYDNERLSVSVSERIIFESFSRHMKSLMLDNFDAVESVEIEDDTKPIKNRLKAISEERDKIQRAWIKKMMSDDDLMKYRKELDDEQIMLEEELSKMGVVKPTVSSSELKGILFNFNELFSDLSRLEQREFVQRHIMKIHFSRKLVKGYQKKYNVKVESVEFF